MKKRFSLAHGALAIAAGLFGLSQSALAAPTYGNIATPPGVYFGSGNVNGNWTIDTANNIEVALRAKDRATGATLDGQDGIYEARSGICNGNGICGGSVLKAYWNFELSVNVRADGSGNADLDDFVVQLEVDTNPTAAMSWTVLNVLSNWPDTEYSNGSTPVRKGSAPLPGEFAAQQSANPMFGDSGFGFLPGAGLYGFRLSVYETGTNGQAGRLLAQTSTQVQVPEPGSLALVGAALFGLAAVRRRRA